MSAPLYDGQIPGREPETGWRIAGVAGMPGLHVIPIGDLIPHEMTEECPCGPGVGVNDVGTTVYDHHALDGRE